MPEIVTGKIGVLNAILSLIIGLGVGWAAFSYIKKSILDTLKAMNDALDKTNQQLEKKVKNLEESNKSQERRIYRVEWDATRKGKMLFAAREEIRLLEKAVGIALPRFRELKHHEVDYERMVAVMTELSDFRHKSQRELDEWEETERTLSAWTRDAESGPGL